MTGIILVTQIIKKVTADGVPIIILAITITMAGAIIMDGETITITTQILIIIIMDGAMNLIIMQTIIIMNGELATIMVGEIIIL